MIVLLSPAKTLDYSKTDFQTHTLPRLLKDSSVLVKNLKQKSAEDIKKLMKVSDKIAELNVDRFQTFQTPFNAENSKQAILAFKGDVYAGMNAAAFDESDLNFAQQHVRILSGLYGLLKPLDLMQPYRLEMGTKLQNKKGKNLYEFWGEKITELINEDAAAQENSPIINLASNEYFKSVKKKNLNTPLYTVNFKEEKEGGFKIVAFFAKKARGMMTNYIVKNKLTLPEELKGFDMERYSFNEELSSEFEYIFTR